MLVNPDVTAAAWPRWLVSGSTVVWAARLAGHIHLRDRGSRRIAGTRGLFLVASRHRPGLPTVVAPVPRILRRPVETGKPLPEKSIRHRRPAYAAYVERISGVLSVAVKEDLT